METAYLTGHFLIAMPAMADPNFHRTVSLLCRHNADGALGLIINRPAEMNLGDLFRQMELEVDTKAFASTSLYYGGPVQQERGFVIHEPKGEWESSMVVTDQLTITTSKDILHAIAHGEGPEHYMITLGYAGWGESQLEQEIVDNAWLNVPADREIIFNKEPSLRWKLAAELTGIEISRLSNQAGHS